MTTNTTGRVASGFVIAMFAASAAFAATTPATGNSAQQSLMKTCNAQATQKGLKGTDRKTFMKSCLSGTGAAAAAPAPVASSSTAKTGFHSTATGAPVTPAAATTPAPSLAPVTTPKPVANKPLTPKPQGNGQATLAKLGTNQFQTEPQAQGHCTTGAVVWVNTATKIYHYKGYSDYGTTKASAFMCEADAKAAGDRAAKDEKAPH